MTSKQELAERRVFREKIELRLDNAIRHIKRVYNKDVDIDSLLKRTEIEIVDRWQNLILALFATCSEPGDILELRDILKERNVPEKELPPEPVVVSPALELGRKVDAVRKKAKAKTKAKAKAKKK